MSPLSNDPMTFEMGREGLSRCSAPSVPPERSRLSLIEDVSGMKFEEKRLRRELMFDVEERERSGLKCVNWMKK